MFCTHRETTKYSNSNWTFIGLNLHYSKGDSKEQQNQKSEPVSVVRDRQFFCEIFPGSRGLLSVSYEWIQILCCFVHFSGPTTIECTLAASSSAVNLLPTVTTLTGTFTSGCTTQGACTFTPNQDLNPKVTSVANHPITGSGQKLTISGEYCPF